MRAQHFIIVSITLGHGGSHLPVTVNPDRDPMHGVAKLQEPGPWIAP